MNPRRYEDIWIGQCSAAREIRERFGLRDAFDYVVGEKLMTYAETAATRPEFARELPRFVAEIRGLFSAEELQEHLARVEHERFQTAKTPARRDRYMALKELLLAGHLGTS
jgi:hypothetical protein